jgi:hypothetical protein
VSSLDDKYILDRDSLIIRQFNFADQGVYYCRAFITLKANFLTKIYPILVQLQGRSRYISIDSLLFFFFVFLSFFFVFVRNFCQDQRDISVSIDEITFESNDYRSCENSTDTVRTNGTFVYCNVHGRISSQTCSIDEIWNNDYQQCTRRIGK